MGEKRMKTSTENSLCKHSEASAWHELYCVQFIFKHFGIDQEMYVLVLIHNLGAIF